MHDYSGFFGHVLLNAPLSVVRVVWYILQQSGGTPTPVHATYDMFMDNLNLSRCGVRDGLQQAISLGYIAKTGESSYALILPVHGNVIANSDKCDYQTVTFQTPIDSNLELEHVESVESNTVQPAVQISDRAEYFSDEALQISESATSMPPYLERLAHNFSAELGDMVHLPSNRQQVYNLWRQSGMSEADFGRLLYHARDLTRRYAVLRPGEKLPSDGAPRNRMAYFFTVVRNCLSERNVLTAENAEKETQRAQRFEYNPPEVKPQQKFYASWLRAAGLT
jgi:hypothetical protein